MASLSHKALFRRLAAITAITRRKVDHRQELRDRAAGARLIRLTAYRAGIDLQHIRGIERLAYMPRQLAERGLTPELDRADAEFIAHDPQLAQCRSWAAQVAHRMPNFYRRPPHGRDARLDDWYAWALAQQRRQADPVHFRREKPVVRLSEYSGHRWRKRATRKTRDAALDRLHRERRDRENGKGGVVSRFAAWAQRLRWPL